MSMINVVGVVVGIVGQAYGLRVAIGGGAGLLVLIILGLAFVWKPVRKLLEAALG